MTRPNLFIVGAMKAGTSSLHSWLSRHPEVFMCTPKEPGFFIDNSQEDPRKAAARGHWNDEELYLKLFEQASGRRFVGESTTDYTKAPAKTGCHSRIHAFNPESRIIYLMRNPFDRAISHYWWNVQNANETRPPLPAIQEDPSYADVSNYAMQLRPYLDEFGRDRVWPMVFEELLTSPRETLRDLCGWLEISIDSASLKSMEQENRTPDIVYRKRFSAVLENFRYSRFWGVAGSFVPRPLRSVGRLLCEARVIRSSEDLTPVKEYLQPVQDRQVRELCELLGRDFPSWAQYECGKDREMPYECANGVPSK